MIIDGLDIGVKKNRVTEGLDVDRRRAQYSRTPHNPYLLVEAPEYGFTGGMGLEEIRKKKSKN
jgi:hypothetical protein